MTVSRAKGAKAKADKYFSLIVRSRGRCEACGDTRYEQLQTAHIISRRYAHTRTNLDNAFCLCAKDHRYFTEYPFAFADFIVGALGRDAYDELHAKSLLRTKVDWSAEAARLQNIWNEIEAAA